MNGSGTESPRSGAHRPAHLDSVDLMRVLTVAGVIAVHVVTGTNRTTSVPAGAATILLHVNREIFVLITALVLTHAYGSRSTWSLREFWRRRCWLVGVPYVVWTVIYFAADRPPAGPVAMLRQLAVDLATGTARYHLYFLLVTLQLYLVFPALLVLVCATRRHHGLLLAVSAALQLAFTAAIHYRLLPGWLDQPDALLPSYQLYVLAGAVGAFHLPELTAWVRAHARLVAALALAGILAGLASYGYDVSVRILDPLTASEVFQPAVTVESLAAAIGLFGLGVWWAGRLRPRWLAVGVRRAADASFGIYLLHPLVLQGGLALAAADGLLAKLLALPGRDALVLGLLAVFPPVALISWLAVALARTGPLSLPLAGRPASRPAAHPAALERRSSSRAANGARTLVLAAALAATTSWLALSPARTTASSVALAGSVPGSATLATSDAPQPPAGAEATLYDVTAGGIARSYQVVRPVNPAAPRLPAIVFLHGVAIDIGSEQVRDGLLPLVAAGQVVLAYPVGYGQSWDAGACCGPARLASVDDESFIVAVAERLAGDPGVDRARISLAGYSNGGKMAYRVACDRPDLFAAVAIVLAVRQTACPAGPPVSLLQVAALDDNEIPYAPGDQPFTADGVLLTPVTSEVAGWRSRDGCSRTDAVVQAGRVRTETWPHCREGARVELATYASGGHYWPAGDAATPPAGRIVWDFVTSAT